MSCIYGFLIKGITLFGIAGLPVVCGGGDSDSPDTTAPDTSISSAPADPTHSTSASFEFASTEALSSFWQQSKFLSFHR
jgi:hypothetical protein